MDRDQWIADKAKTEAEARELGALDPTIRVNMSTTEAFAQIEALRAASGHVKAGPSVSGDAAAALDTVAASEDKVANSTIRANEANKTSVSRMALMGAGIAALIPLLPPLIGFATGVAGAFAGMGGAGVAAVLGVKTAMADGTATGNTYRAGLTLLKNDMDQLSATSANAMLMSFDTALSTINSRMPGLNNEFGLFSTQLGTVGNLLLRGVLNAFQALTPLFLTAGVYVERLAAGFQSWTTDGGVQKFGDYALRTFPQVATTLDSLVHVVLNLVTALAPIGAVSMTFIQGLAQIVSWLTSLGAVLPVVVGGIGAGLLAFKAWGVVAPMLANVAERAAYLTKSMLVLNGAIRIATGPIGWVVAGLSALVAMLGISAAAAAGAKATTDSYTAALQQDSGVIGENVRAQAAKNLQDEGAFKTAKQLGLATDQLVAAVMRNNTALKTVTDSVKRADDAYQKAITTAAEHGRITTMSAKAQRDMKTRADATATAVTNNAESLKAAVNAYNEYAKATGDATISTKDQLSAQVALASRYGMSVPAYLTAVGAQQKTAAQLTATTQAMQIQGDAAGLLTNAITLLNGGTLSLAQAQTGAGAALNSLLDALKSNGAAIDGNSKAAIANQQALEQKAAADQQAAEATAKATGSTQAGTSALAASKSALEATLRATGNLTPAIQALIDKWYAVPTVVRTKAEMDTSAADAAMNAFMHRWSGAAVNLTATGSGNLGSGILGHANGGTIGMAGGGTAFGFGGPKSDSIVTRLSPGEEVIQEPYATEFRPQLKMMNQGVDPYGAMQRPQQSVPVGPMRIVGTLDLGNGLVGLVDGMIKQAAMADAQTVQRGFRGIV